MRACVKFSLFTYPKIVQEILFNYLTKKFRELRINRLKTVKNTHPNYRGRREQGYSRLWNCEALFQDLTRPDIGIRELDHTIFG